jgi:SAM-dependent methyltransferase
MAGHHHDQACPVCGGGRALAVLSLAELPVLINAQVSVEDAPHVTKGHLDLVVCEDCAHLYNRSFDESLLDYDATYENTLHFSASFRDWADGLRDRLIATHDLVGGRVAELGSGPGHFLSMLCDGGVAAGFGFDPSYDAGRLGAPSHPGVGLSTDLYPAGGALSVDLAFSQHVLEHLDDPVAALADLRASVVDHDGVVYTEVPNGDLMIRDCALWDLIYEHRSYFVETSLRRAHQLAGLTVSDLGTAFGEQFLWAEGRPTAAAADVAAVERDERIDLTVAKAVAFGRRASERVDEARRELAALTNRGPVVLWGSGSKGMTWLNLVARDQAVTVVDINPRKTGWGVPGTGHRIDDPASLSGVGAATVLLANPAYRHEVSAQLAELGVVADVVALWGE